MASAYTRRSYIENERSIVRGSRLGWMNDSMVSGPSRLEGPDIWQGTGSTDISCSNFLPSSQSCSMYVPPQRDDIPSVQPTTVLSASENASGSVDKKPALPPKPQGPPSYREPPVPPVHEETNQHPDICINSAPPPRPEHKPHPSESAPVIERPDRLGSRTHAWVQEHKTSGKLVGEKLSSLQRKLRSLLTQSSTKESTDIEKGVSIEEKPAAEGHDAWNYHSSSDISLRPKTTYSSYKQPSTSSSQEQRLSYMSSSYSSGAASMSSIHPSTHNHANKTSFLHERHPFGAPANFSEQEDAADAEQLRDACNKFFSRDQRISWTNYLSPRNCYSNNIKSSYDYDKLVPKEVIGRPSQEKKPEIVTNCETIYGGITPLPSFSKSHEIPTKQTDTQPPRIPDTLEYESSYFARRVENLEDEANVQHSEQAESQVPNKESEAAPPQETLPCAGTDYGDTNDFYKSSSESGRGTMHSSMHGSKSIVSPHSSGVSAVSNLDTSLDSDHSVNGTLWDQHDHVTKEKRLGEEYQGNQVRHIYETPNTRISCRQPTEKDDVQDDVTSESLSVTPPLPPLSPAPSPPLSAENSPKLSSRAKYKLSLSASALNSNYNKPNDHQQKVCEIPSSKSSQGKKSGVRRTTSINQATCRHRTGKTYQCSKGPSTSGHRLGISHGNCSSKKCSSSPPSRHHSRTQLAYPCYIDNGDAELTSTTTGLDMESLLDDADDYSSDLSATASSMEPSEVNMIRKQLEGLEAMYSEILHVLGVKNSCKDNTFGGSAFDMSHHSRRRINESLSSLTARSSASRGNHNFADKRGFSEKRRSKSDCRLSSASKRLQRLESHVVTLARSVAHLSSEMRTQHVLVQELENMRQDVSWVQERMRLMQLAQGCHSGNGSRNHQLAMPRDWDNFHREVLELLNPCRAKKLTKFFGDEPPLIRQFLKRLGYEKYATNFENEKIGIKELPYLTEERLQKMGIPMGPRIRILQEAHACCQQNQYKVYIV